MVLAIDVHYSKQIAVTSGVTFEHWQDAQPHSEYLSLLSGVADYVPGEFFLRGLPCILKLLADHHLQPDCILVDGYVFLDGDSKPGLGKYLYDGLRGKAAVVGVAKRSFGTIDPRYEVFRGRSNRPLYVTAVGMNVAQAKKHVLEMAGGYRLPALLRRVDRLCRAVSLV